MRTSYLAGPALGMAASLALAAIAPAEASPISIGRQKQLLVDDYIIERMDGVKRTLNQPRKYGGNPLLVPGQDWQSYRMLMYGSVIHDAQAKLFKMWYWLGWDLHEGYGMTGAYATSPDGLHWLEPELNLLDFQGSKRNNRIPWMAMGMIHSPGEADPGKRYKSLSGHRGAFSADGLTWHVPPESKAIPGDVASDGVAPFVYDEQSKRYVAFPKVVRESGGHLRRAVGVSFSDDFLTWTPVQTILVPDGRDDGRARQAVAAHRDRIAFEDGSEWHLAQFYGHCGFPYEGMYLGLLWVFNISGWPPWIAEAKGRRPSAGSEDGPTYVQLTSSRDLVNWQRVGDRLPFIPLGDADSYDAGTIYTANRPLIVGDEIWIYYSGEQFTHGHPLLRQWAGAGKKYPGSAEAIARASPRARGSINLAKLRLDGWVSVDASSKEGILTTKPLLFDGNRLIINAEARRGVLRVEVLNEAGKPIRGFALPDSQEFTGNSVRHAITWAHGATLDALRGKPVRLRFRLTNARLYSFGFQ
jgi:hypothetical protein